MQKAPQLAMSVQRIKRTDPSTNGEGGKQFAGFGNLVGFFAHLELGPDFLAVVRESRESRWRASRSAVLAPRTVLPSTARGSVAEARLVALTHVESTRSTASALI